MRRSAAVVSAVLATGGLASVVHAGYVHQVLDVSGMSSWGIEGDLLNETRAFDEVWNRGIILEIRYSLQVQTFGGSQLSDIVVDYRGSTGFFHGDVWPETFRPFEGQSGSGLGFASGEFSTDFHLDRFDPEFQVTLFEMNDDLPGQADAVFLDGSYISVGYFIPAPASALSLIGLVAVGRRRR